MMTPAQVFARGAHACIVAAVLTCAGFAAESVKVHFDLAPDSAEKSLKQFSAQSGVEVIFSTDLAANVKTNGLTGDFTPREALNRILAGTPLVATENAKSGAFTLSRASDPNAP